MSADLARAIAAAEANRLTHVHWLPIHDVWRDVFRAQAEALIARGWTRAALSEPVALPEAHDAE